MTYLKQSIYQTSYKTDNFNDIGECYNIYNY